MSLESPREEDLLRRAGDGDGDAFEALVKPHLSLFYNGIHRILGDPSDSQDALQDALIAIFRDLPRFESRSRFSTWAYRICINAALMQRRSRSRRREETLTDHQARYDSTGHNLDPLAGLDWSVQAEALATAENRELRSKLLAVLGELPDTQRVVFILRELEDWNSEQIADHLGIAADAVRQRLHRARTTIQVKLRAFVAERKP
jgi:RNA polymerase sigma-70 factor (ECF subfamily)